MRHNVILLLIVLLASGLYAQEPQAKSPIRFNFESGDLQGWKVISGQFGPLPAYNDNDRHGGNFNKEGKYFIGTCELGNGPFNDAMTGRIRSPIFTISASKITLLVGGGNNPDETFVALYRASDNKELFRETGRNAEAMERRTWDVSAYKGTACYIEIVDEAGGGWGHINVDDIRELTPEEEAQIALQEEARRKAKQEALAAWRKSLFERGSTKVYTGAELTKIAMPMGGIGAGSIALCGNGTLREWQIFNNVDKSALLPYSFFAIWAKRDGALPVAKLLQSEPIGAMPAIEATEFSGEYPIGWIRYKDKELPLEIQLECYSPMIPLNPKDSALPGVVYTFRVKNTGEQKVSASLAASLQNGVGYEGHGKIEGVQYRDFCANRNAIEKRGNLTAIAMRPTVGNLGRFEKPLRVWTQRGLMVQLFKLSENLRLEAPDWWRQPILRLPPATDIARNFNLIHLGDMPANLTVDSHAIDNLCEGVRNGGNLLLTGQGRTLLTLVSAATADAEIFDDFETGTYEKWTVEGDAFGNAPAQARSGTQPMPGQQGKFFAFSFPGSDAPRGKLTSKPFRITKKYIHFLLGGGRFPKETCFNLKIDDKVVRTACGENQNYFRRIRWDVTPYIGKEAVFEVVDARSGPWGSIFVDDIRFSDSPELPPDATVAAKVRQLLPVMCDEVARMAKPIDVPCDKASPIFKNLSAATLRLASFLSAKPKDGTRVLSKSTTGEPLIIEGAFGKGRVVLCLASLEDGLSGVDRKTFVGNIIAYASGTNYLPPTGVPKTAPTFGSMVLGTLAANPRCLAQWDDAEKFWKEFSTSGNLFSEGESGPSKLGRTWNGALAVPFTLAPGQETTVTFLITWHFPNHYKDDPTGYNVYLGNMYNSWFNDALDVAAYLADNFARLSAQTKLYHDTLYDTTLPRWVMDLVSSQSSIIRTQTLMWLAEDVVAGYEGCGATEGCCPMNCTHVYNYEQALAHLYPSLERNMRLIDLKVQIDPMTGMIHHRTNLPLSAPRGSGEAIDGQLGTILKAYREHLRSADRDFLDSVWLELQAAMDYVMVDHDANGDGVIDGRQFNTYDCAIYGPNTFIGSLYLAALRAMEEMAKIKHEPELAKRYRDRYEKGRARLEKELWNGEYFIQKYDEQRYPDCEYGTGCFSDQVLGQWWAHVNNLGYVLSPDKVKTALRSIFKYNWLTDFTNFRHFQRVFADGEDKGLLICTWPKGGRPERPIYYCDEVWTGVEYQVAAHMIWEGLIEEAFQIAKGARERYNGIKRNPWNDIECGDHYARAMSSWSVLLALEGFIYDGPAGLIGFAPSYTPENFRAFFTGAEGWGTFAQIRTEHTQRCTLEIKYGHLVLRELVFKLPEGVHLVKSVAVSGVPEGFSFVTEGGKIRITLAQPFTLSEGQQLQATIRW